jgi:RNA polymerase sigma factor (sigma-70 family)
LKDSGDSLLILAKNLEKFAWSLGVIILGTLRLARNNILKERFYVCSLATDKKHIDQLVDHLYRHESGKLVAVLTRVFGTENIELAEDVVQDSLIEAMKDWPYKGLPSDPSAWLYKVARNKALNILNRERYKRQYASDVTHQRQSVSATPVFDDLFSEHEVQDDQLRMIFTACHPAISKDSQVALTLKTLCGFSIPEIAHAFFTTDDTINKRLVRARQKIREAKIPFEFPAAGEIEERLEAVLETIYLVFNEGYSASSGDELIRYELCEEAIRLAEMIAAYPRIQNRSNVYALLSLMLLNASRFASRTNKEGDILTLAEQDRSLWNIELIEKGLAFLQRSTGQNTISIYHILATISAYHCAAPDFESTDWKGILTLYDHLILLDHSPLIKLNRLVPLAKVMGAEKALEALQQLKEDASINSYHLLYATEGEFYWEMNEYKKAAEAFQKAINYSLLQAEKHLLQNKLESCLKKLN